MLFFSRYRHGEFSRIASTALICLVLAGCVSTTQQDPVTSGGPVAPAKLPKGIHRTDGHHPIHIGGGGAADCRRTTPEEAAHALAVTNAMRAASGLSALGHDAKLQRAAEDHACDMARRGVMDHAGSGTSGPGQRVKALGYRPKITAENIAAGSVSLFDLEGALREWASSPGHSANILLPGIREFGTGRAYSIDGRISYVAAVYAAPL